VTEEAVIRQGDIYWVDLGLPVGSSLGYRHPHVVIQNDLFNRSRIATVIVCALTSNLRRAGAPGNVLLDQGEASMPRLSVVNVSEVVTVDKSQLDEHIGTLSRRRMRQILDGLHLITEPADVD
jgi:mRNA interferase MazF